MSRQGSVGQMQGVVQQDPGNDHPLASLSRDLLEGLSSQRAQGSETSWVGSDTQLRRPQSRRWNAGHCEPRPQAATQLSLGTRSLLLVVTAGKEFPACRAATQVTGDPSPPERPCSHQRMDVTPSGDHTQCQIPSLTVFSGTRRELRVVFSLSENAKSKDSLFFVKRSTPTS